MSLLVEYSLKDGQSDAQIDALKEFCAGLKEMNDPGFTYTAFATDDPNKFIAVFEFDDDDAKDRFLKSDPFQTYRDGAGARFAGPPSTTTINFVSSSRP